MKEIGGGKMYYALITDIVNSKLIEDRYQTQEKLSQYLDQLNEEYDSNLASGFSIALGDEFQALFSCADKLFETMMKIEVHMKPIEFRFAIGVGDITTSIRKNQSIGSDGLAWWSARDTLIELKKNHKKGLKEVSNIRIDGLMYQELNELLNVSLSLSAKIKEKWTTQQKTIIEHLINTYGLSISFTQSEVAQHLGLSAPDLNKKLKLSNYYDYVSLFDKITKVLKKEVEGK